MPRPDARSVQHVDRPIRVMELRSVIGNGGGPDKTILLGAAHSDPSRFAVTVCYVRDRRDDSFAIDRRARELGVDYCEVVERHSFDPAIFGQLRRLTRDRHIDIVHAHEYKTDFLALALSRFEPVTPLATVHGWIRNTFREHVYCLADRKLLARYPVVIAVSESIRQTLLANGALPSAVRRIPNGIDHRLFTGNPGVRVRLRRAVGIPEDAFVLGAVGRLGPEKRHDLLIAAAARLVELAPHVVLAGDGPCGASLMEAARQAGISTRVHLLGHRDDPQDVHQMFDLYVQTSDTEGVPNAVLEAMAVRTPVVATRVGGTGDILAHDREGLLVAPGNLDSVVAAIERTVADPLATATRVAAARARIEGELSFAARMACVEQIYEELAGSDRNSRLLS